MHRIEDGGALETYFECISYGGMRSAKSVGGAIVLRMEYEYGAWSRKESSKFKLCVLRRNYIWGILGHNKFCKWAQCAAMLCCGSCTSS